MSGRVWPIAAFSYSHELTVTLSHGIDGVLDDLADMIDGTRHAAQGWEEALRQRLKAGERPVWKDVPGYQHIAIKHLRVTASARHPWVFNVTLLKHWKSIRDTVSDKFHIIRPDDFRIVR